MQPPEKKANAPAKDRLEAATGEAFEHTPEGGSEEWRDSFWDCLVSFWGTGGAFEPDGAAQRLESQTPAPEAQLAEASAPEAQASDAQYWLIEEWDFSSEHGYEPGFEGRSEFEYGEFERWV